MTEAPIISRLRNPRDVIRYSKDIDLEKTKDFYACPPYGVLLGEFERISSFNVHYPLTIHSNVLRVGDQLGLVIYHTYNRFNTDEILVALPQKSDTITSIESYFIIDRNIEIVKAKLRLNLRFTSHRRKHKKPIFKLSVLEDSSEEKWRDFKFKTQSLKTRNMDNYVFTADLTSLLQEIAHSPDFEKGVEIVESSLNQELENSLSEFRNSDSESLLVQSPLDFLHRREELQLKLVFGFEKAEEFIEWDDGDSYLSIATLEGEVYGSHAVSALCNVFSGITQIQTSDSASPDKVSDSSILTAKSTIDLLLSSRLDLKSLFQKLPVEKSVQPKKSISFGQIFVSPIPLLPHSISLFDFSIPVQIEPDLDLKLIRFHLKDEPFIANVLISTLEARYILHFQFSVENSEDLSKSFSPELIAFNKYRSTVKYSILFPSSQSASLISIKSY